MSAIVAASAFSIVVAAACASTLLPPTAPSSSSTTGVFLSEASNTSGFGGIQAGQGFGPSETLKMYMLARRLPALPLMMCAFFICGHGGEWLPLLSELECSQAKIQIFDRGVSSCDSFGAS